MRSIWKGPFINPKLLNMILKAKEDKKYVIKTWYRSSFILPNFIGTTLYIHNGKTFSRVFINESMIGRKLGEFCKTRKSAKHNNAKK